MCDLIPDRSKSATLYFAVWRKRYEIVEFPMNDLGSSRRAFVTCSHVVQGNDEVERLLPQIIHGLRHLVIQIDSDFLHDLFGERVHVLARNACAERIEITRINKAQQSFRHGTMGTICRAQEQHSSLQFLPSFGWRPELSTTHLPGVARNGKLDPRAGRQRGTLCILNLIHDVDARHAFRRGIPTRFGSNAQSCDAFRKKPGARLLCAEFVTGA